MKTTGDESEDAFSGETVPFEMEKSEEVANEVTTNSRERYGTPVKEVEAYLEELLKEPEKKPRKQTDSTNATQGKPERVDRKSGEPKGERPDEKYEG
jgi:hypothetical protein